jgi:hypothetical protein
MRILKPGGLLASSNVRRAMKEKTEQYGEFLYLELDYLEVGDLEEKPELELEEERGVFVGDLVPDSYAS